MTNITRYIGKIKSIFKQDGFWNGIKKIFQAFFVILKPIGSGDILFVSSGIIGSSFQYRVKNVAEELELQGFSCKFAIQENPLLPFCADKFKIFIFHRTNYTPQIARLVKKIKKLNKEIIFETDDLLFNPSFIRNQDFFKNSNALMQKFYEKGIGTEFIKDSYVKVCTTTTSFLAKKLEEYNKKVFIVPNKLSVEDLKIAQEISEKINKNQSSKVRIGYFSGGSSHNKDFAEITEPLLEILEKYPQTELLLFGPLEINGKFKKYGKQIQQLPFVSRKEHFENIAKIDISVAPLENNNLFCEAKSELKFFEAGIFGIPTVASATQTFKEAIVDKEDGFVANTKEEWIKKVSFLIENDFFRKEMGEKARKKSLEKYTTKNSFNEEYYNYLKSNL